MSTPRQRTPSLRTTAEMHRIDAAPPRLGFVQYQIGLARLSISLQVPRAARAALLVLGASDFPADPETAQAYLTALRDPALCTADIVAAVDALAALAGLGDPAPNLRPSEG